VNLKDLKARVKTEKHHNTSPVQIGEVSDREAICIRCGEFGVLVWNGEFWLCLKCSGIKRP
jgi:ribosomal protein S27AE